MIGRISPARRVVSRGFTLIELLVSISIFSIVVLVVMGAVMSIISANRKAQTMTSVINNLDFALESMTRTIKTGSGLKIGSGAGTSVSVCDEDGHAVTYYFDPAPAERIVIQREIGTSCNDTAAKTEMALTAPEVKITGLNFYGFPAKDNPSKAATQPAVLMSVKGYMEINPESRSDFNIQTTVALRALNIK